MSGSGKYRQIVDENDVFIGHKWKEEFEPSKDIYRVSALWLRNSNGEVLIAKRGVKKKNGGGKWGPAVSGTLEYDETYEENIVKEIKEEIGLAGLNLVTGQKRYFETDNRKYFCTYYYGVSDVPAEDFVLEEVAVEAVKWVSEDWLLKDIQEHSDMYVEGLSSRISEIMNDCRLNNGGNNE